MAKQKITSNNLKTKDYEINNIITLWLCRSLAYREITNTLLDNIKEHHNTLKRLGLVINDPDDLTVNSLRKIAKEKEKEMKKTTKNNSGVFFSNFNYLCDQLELNPVERDVFLFSVLAISKKTFSANMTLFGDFTPSSIVNALSLVLNIPPELVNKALDSNSILKRSGVIGHDYTDVIFSNFCLEIIDGLQYMLFQVFKKPNDIMSNFINHVCKPTTTLKDFSYIGEDLTIINRYLSGVLKSRVKGVNILLYGLPGTGKTELAKVIANTQDVDLFDLRKNLSTSDEAAGKQRLSAYQITQELLSSKKQSMIMFDEIEDVFDYSAGSFGLNVRSSNKKSFINKVLETNKVPAIWISNEIRQIDPAFIRRFDYVLHVPIPEKEIRKNIISKQLTKYNLPEQYINELASNDSITNAHFIRAKKIIDTSKIKKKKDITKTMTKLINNTLLLSDEKKISMKTDEKINSYNIDYIDTSEDMVNIIDVISDGEGARLCLHGVPGTGKTAFAKHLTQKLNRPLHFTRSSDILGKYIGETEKNIAKLFEQGKKDNGIILLDEADSLMSSRNSNMKSWEVSKVNEMLSRLEEYEGVFIATTNRLELLDTAMLRRFDLTIEFMSLSNLKKWKVFSDVIKLLKFNIKKSDVAVVKQRIYSLENITVSDFFNVKRKVERFDKNPTVDSFIHKLEDVVGLKNLDSSKPIGFMS